MNDQNQPAAPAAEAPVPEAPVSQMSVQFVGVGAVDFSVHVENVSPLQILAVCAWLEVQARRQLERAQLQAEQAKPQLVVPRPGRRVN